VSRCTALVVVLASLVMALCPDVAFACPVCFQAKNDASRLAFLVTTLFMTVLPLGLFGGLAYWVKRRSEALDEGSTPESEETAPDREPVAHPVGKPTPVR
jgi:hypothetical protein